MNTTNKHIETAITPGPAGASYSAMYLMHKYWSKKPSEIISRYIDTYSKEGDIILDPFSGYGVTAIEALKLKRRVVAIDLNPMATFIARTVIKPVNLAVLNWSFRDIETTCRKQINELYATKCIKCGKKATVEFVIRKNTEPIEIAYTCDCSKTRLFKKPDKQDRRRDEDQAHIEIPFWYPENVLLPTTQPEKFSYAHELFTRRNLAALSIILNSIKGITNESVRNVLELAFTAALDKCSRLKPVSELPKQHPTLSLGWVATRFYTPTKWQEVNPWEAFCRTFERVYAGKKESNDVLSHVVMGNNFEELLSNKANVIILDGSSDKILSEMQSDSVDYVLTDPPFGSAIQYLTLSTFWGIWLGFEFDYDNEIVVNKMRGKLYQDYYMRLSSLFSQLSRVTKQDSYVHVFCNDVNGPYLHKVLNFLNSSYIIPQRIIHQPPPNSFGVVARTRLGHFGSYIVRGQVSKINSKHVNGVSEEELRHKLADTAILVLAIQNSDTTINTILHSVYQQLNEDEIYTFSKYSADDFIKQSTKDFTDYRNGRIKLKDSDQQFPLNINIVPKDFAEQIRRAVLDASSLLSSETDPINRVRQLTLIRFKNYGITPQNIQEIERSIKPPEQVEYGKKRFAYLLSIFGEKLGYGSHLSLAGNIVKWTKGNNFACSFEIGDKDIRIFSTIPSTNRSKSADWGVLSRINLEHTMWKWCQRHPQNQNGLIEHIIPLDGPSYELLTEFGDHRDQLRHMTLEVTRKTMVCPDHYLIQMVLPNIKLNIRPGQFFHIICDPGASKEDELTLRRPFSIHGAEYANFDRGLLAQSAAIPEDIRSIIERWPTKINFLFKVVGDGTKSLSRVPLATSIDVIGPCGNGFSLDTATNAIIVAGGIGVAPLVALVENLRYLNKNVYVYLGALHRDLLGMAVKRTDSDIEMSFSNGNPEFVQMIRSDFGEIGIDYDHIQVCTDDGSEGYKGFVTEKLDNDFSMGLLPRSDVCLYACGPHDMLKAMAAISKRYSINCQVLLEERMACGIGACLSCVCNITGADGTTQKKRVCKDGPVFDSREIQWRN
ncbi:MAG: DNA methyltransferase [Dehalococcoidia bacterium]